MRGSGDHDHPQAGNLAARLVVRRHDAPQQVAADARPADADDADDLVLGVPEPVAQLGPRRAGSGRSPIT